LSNTREFEYKGKHVKIAATRMADGKYVGIPIIDGEVARGCAPAGGKARVNEALGEGERRAKEFIDG
jgi:hypothetical protein